MAGDREVEVARRVVFPRVAAGETWTVGAVILDRSGAAFAQRQSPGRRLFPDCWDLVGGHVEPGESLLDALAREIAEETGWRLRRVTHHLGTSVWTGDDGAGVRHEADYVVEVDGDLANPALEWSKNSAYAWFAPTDLARLKENRAPGEYLVHDLVAAALAWSAGAAGEPRSRQANG